MSKQRKINPDTSHRWAHQIGDYSETKGGRLFFRGDTIYSYGHHFPIARHVRIEERRCILFTTRTYSATTRGHCIEVERAIPGSISVFHVDNVRAGENAEHYPEDVLKQHTHNLCDYQARIVETAGNAKRARSNKDRLLGQLDRSIAEHNGYIDFFKLDALKIEQGDGLLEKLLKGAEEARRREIERIRADQERIETENFSIIKLWQQGNYSFLPSGLRKVYLRKNPLLSGQLETSKGAYIPLGDARKAFEVARKCHDRKKGFSPNGHSLHVGNYTIDSIDAEGNVRAGCHLVQWPQIEEFSKKEGWCVTAAEELVKLQPKHA